MRKINLLKIFPITLSIFLISALLPHSVLALEENFDALDNTIWQVYQNAGSINIGGGTISLSADYTATFPFIHSRINPIPTSGDFSVKFRMKYNRVTTKGTGLILATETPPNGSSDPSLNDPVFSRRYFLGIWQDSITGFYFQYSGNCYNQSCSADQLFIWKKGSQDLNYHTIEFLYTNNKYSISLDDTNIFTSDPIEIRPTILWFGNPTIQGEGAKWTSFEIDYIYINPPVSSLQPLILLPGFGASWNYEAMILGKEKEPKDWSMTPFVKVYDGLIQTLQNAGYELGTNLFVFNYDWRKSVDSIADDLKNYIETTVDPPPETKIDLVGHSLGGMVARTYIQKNPENHQVDQLITLGSPHKGAVKAYYFWEGANLNKALSAWQRIGAGILLQIHKKSYENVVEAIHSVVPGLKDLLPTFSYLKRDGLVIPIENMSERNEWLASLNSTISTQLLELSNTFVGTPFDTLRWIKVTNRNSLDQLLGKWVDGKPIGEEFAPGDRTVLAESARLEGANVIELENIDHGDLVKTVAGQQAIVNLLELSPSEIVPAPEVAYEPLLVFQLASPATIKVIDPLGRSIGFGVPVSEIPNAIYSPQDKLIIIPEALEGEYQAVVKREGSGGEYRLLVGQSTQDKDIWTEFQGDTSEEETKKFVINSDPTLSKTKRKLLLLAKKKLIKFKRDFKKIITKSDNRVYIRGFDRFIRRHINREIRRIRRSLRLLRRNKTNRANRQIKKSIFRLTRLERRLKFWRKLRLITPKEELLLTKELREVKDLLIQAYEIEPFFSK